MLEMGEEAIFSFGVIADVQYADLDNRMNYAQTSWRYYRNSLTLLKEAVDTWTTSLNPTFVLQLGDLIDGLNRRGKHSEEAVNKTSNIFSRMPVRVHHVIGNHELYNFKKSDLLNGPLFKDNGHEISKAYYDFSPHAGYRIVILDCYDIAMLGYEPTDEKYIEAETLLRKHNNNHDLNSPTGLEHLERRFLQFNGAIGQDQLSWLEGVLQAAEDNHEQVIIAGEIFTFIFYMLFLIISLFVQTQKCQYTSREKNHSEKRISHFKNTCLVSM